MSAHGGPYGVVGSVLSLKCLPLFLVNSLKSKGALADGLEAEDTWSAPSPRSSRTSRKGLGSPLWALMGPGMGASLFCAYAAVARTITVARIRPVQMLCSLMLI